ncbi:hypothetical protein [Sorangium sp. So ce117]|uniref:hypothetical protein n=1 Tax=Sorangium sp. So ce117 TaxID=3133277 RepID=UPI003F642FC3
MGMRRSSSACRGGLVLKRHIEASSSIAAGSGMATIARKSTCALHRLLDEPRDSV